MMKKLLFLFFCSLSSLLSWAQVIYSDNFDSSQIPLFSSDAYTLSITDNVVRIKGNGSAGQYEGITYQLHANGNARLYNLSSAPVVYLKVRGNAGTTLRVDLKDETGYVTNQQPSSITLTENYTIYSLDFSSRLRDGGFGGPCTKGEAPCTVDAKVIRSFEFIVNPGVGNFDGAIDVEWVSVGESFEELPDYDLRYNQVGYVTGQSKLITILSSNTFDPKSFSVEDEAGTTVLSGTSGTVASWTDAQSYVSTIDISTLDIPGTYRLKTEKVEIKVNISANPYDTLAIGLWQYYYLNRASASVEEAYAGTYARNAGHPDDRVIIHRSAASSTRPAGTIISASKGWYDAGDYNKYIVNSGISTYTLLAAYEHYSEYYDNLALPIPEQNNALPDILDEALWNLEWMLDMQDPEDGGVYHKLTGLQFTGIEMPDEYTMDRYVVQKSVTATLNFAAVMAVASRVFSQFEAEKPGLSVRMLQAAEAAYQWAKIHPTVYYEQPQEINTGEYGDANASDEFLWAATELYITSQKEKYKNNLNFNKISPNVPGWPSVGGLAYISVLYHKAELSDKIDMLSLESNFLKLAQELRDRVTTTPARIAMKHSSPKVTDYVWGSNGVAGNQALVLLRAFELTKDETYRNAAYVTSDYVLGRNGTGFCYVTGYGSRPSMKPHHRISQADGVSAPVPGMVVGGPNPKMNDQCNGYLGNAPATAYLDDWCSYASNEVTINWNAPWAYVFSALMFYGSDSSLSTNLPPSALEKELRMFPNPTSGTVNIELSSRLQNILTSIEVFSIQGKKMKSINTISEQMVFNFSDFAAGIYFMNINTTSGMLTKKVVKI